MKTRDTTRKLTRFCAFTTTVWDSTASEGIPSMAPSVARRRSPAGRAPDSMEKERELPDAAGTVEKVALMPMR